MAELLGPQQDRIIKVRDHENEDFYHDGEVIKLKQKVVIADDGSASLINSEDGSVAHAWAAPTVDTVVTYTFTGPDADGVITATGSDGSVQTIQLPADSDAVTTAIVDDALVFYDADGNEITSLAQDLSQFISSPHPTITGANDAIIAEDADGNYVVSFVDTDTDTTYTIVGGNLVGSDGTSAPLPVDTDTSLSVTSAPNPGTTTYSTDYTLQNVDINGDPVGTATVLCIPDNPVVNVGCDSRTFWDDRKDGTTMFRAFTRVFKQLSFAHSQLTWDSSSPIGPVAGSEISHNVTLDNIVNMRIQSFAEISLTVINQVQGTGQLSLISQVSYDGGATWADMSGGGGMFIRGDDPEFQDQHFSRRSQSGVTVGTLDVRYRLRVDTNTLPAGAEVRNNTITYYSDYLQAQCESV